MQRIKMNKAYISLGSNKGQRLKNIQEAVIQIQKNIGVLMDLSSLYQTPSWGFEGPDFINACIGVKTVLPALDVLQKLLKIELQLGRFRTPAPSYSSRTIDLDLLFYEEQVIDHDDLILPHPRLELRNFILFPMCEIAPEFVHPRLGKNMTELSGVCPDNSQPHKMPLNKWSPDLFIENQILVFEGNIGVGKTSLAHKVISDYQVPALLENFTKNPYLEKFYNEPECFALPLEKYFLEDRFRQFNDFIQSGISPKIGVADHSLFKSLVFAKINLSYTAFDDFNKNYERLLAKGMIPQKVVLLHQSIKILMKQIKRRGRAYEQSISSAYLEKIDLGYKNYLNTGAPFPYLILDLDDLDFVNDERAYQIVLQRIKAF